jgi:uncharacterized protein YggE
MRDVLGVRFALVTAGLIAVAVIVSLTAGFRSVNTGGPPTVTLTGTGSAAVTPTGAVATLGIETSAPSAAQALAANNRAMADVVARLARLGLPARDLQTQGLAINPETGSGSPPPITGYQVIDTINVTMPQVDSAGRILDAAVAAGANEIDGISFTGGNVRAAYTVAYRAAVADARTQAQALAAAFHEHVAGVVAVRVPNDNPVTLTYAPMAQAAVGTPVFPGQTSETVSVQVTFRLAP